MELENYNYRKLANKFRNAGKSVIIGAADTFSAGAIDQLEFGLKEQT